MWNVVNDLTGFGRKPPTRVCSLLISNEETSITEEVCDALADAFALRNDSDNTDISKEVENYCVNFDYSASRKSNISHVQICVHDVQSLVKARKNRQPPDSKYPPISLFKMCGIVSWFLSFFFLFRSRRFH